MKLYFPFFPFSNSSIESVLWYDPQVGMINFPTKCPYRHMGSIKYWYYSMDDSLGDSEKLSDINNIIHPSNVRLRDQLQMPTRLGIFVQEGHIVGIFIDDESRYLTGDDLAENTHIHSL